MAILWTTHWLFIATSFVISEPGRLQQPPSLWVYSAQMLHGTGIFAYIYHKIEPNVGKYSTHGAFGVGSLNLIALRDQRTIAGLENGPGSKMYLLLQIGDFPLPCQFSDTKTYFFQQGS